MTLTVSLKATRFKSMTSKPMASPDVAVVGGGPAGSAAAWELARTGARVLLFDASHPREKPCGGGLTDRALSLVRQMLGPRMVPGITVRRLRFEAGPPGSTLVAAFPIPEESRETGAAPAPALVVVSRRALDEALFEAALEAGAEPVRERVRAVAVHRTGAEMTTTGGTWRAGVVLGADGATSVVRRHVSAPFTRAQVSIATGYYAHGVSSDEAIVHCFPDPPGYLWSFPRSNHLAVGVCAPGDQVDGIGGLRATTLAWLERAGLPKPASLEPYSWPIPSLGHSEFGRLPIARGRWMLLGDAAGLVDPLTREGLYFALRSGVLAADAMAREADPAAAYEARVASEIHPELARAAALRARFFTSGFSELLVAGLERSRQVREIMVDLIAGRQTYRSLPRRLVRTWELGLAWRFVQLEVRGMVS